MKIGVLLLNFGEPEEATMEAVVPFLERIFTLNAPLMGRGSYSAEEIRAHSHTLALERAPGLIAEYEEIGGSPLLQQAREQVEALEEELTKRGRFCQVFVGMQFTDPSIADAVSMARDAGVEVLVPLPVYPLCGPTTTVAALDEVGRQLERLDWRVSNRPLSGWHRHPTYLQLRADAIRDTLEKHRLSLADPNTVLVFSAHGTPLKYLEAGSRYREYVDEICSGLARELGAGTYRLGFQNHSNRPGVRWTQPDIEEVVREVAADRIVVDAVSFMHEQSETLAELDGELREVAEGRGIEFFRVPIPHLEPRFIGLLADLVEAAVEEGVSRPRPMLTPCRCRAGGGTRCTNG